MRGRAAIYVLGGGTLVIVALLLLSEGAVSSVSP